MRDRVKELREYIKNKNMEITMLCERIAALEEEFDSLNVELEYANF